MKIGFSLPLLLLLFFGVMGLFSAQGEPRERYPWLSNLEEARALASAQGKPMLLVFRCEP